VLLYMTPVCANLSITRRVSLQIQDATFQSPRRSRLHGLHPRSRLHGLHPRSRLHSLRRALAERMQGHQVLVRFNAHS
jgi:hypothetical protein